MSGTVNIPRSIWHDPAFKSEPFTEREAFMWITMEASYKPREKRVGNVSVSLDRGQLATSIRFMCEAWGWSKSRVDRFLKRLENRDIIKVDSGTGVNLITVCNYNEDQNVPSESGTAKSKKRDSSGTAAGQQRDKPNKGLIPDAKQPEAGLFPDLQEPVEETPLSILCDVIPEQLSRDFIEHRRSLKKPLSILAARRVASDLATFQDPKASVDNSIKNGWLGVFDRDPPKTYQGSGGSSAPVDGIMARVNQRYGGRP